MANKFWNSEKILSLSAMFISLITLIVFIYQTDLIRVEQHKSVYPYLSISNGGSGSTTYRYILENKGIGPAVLTSIKVTDADDKVYDDIIHYLAEKLVTINDTTIGFYHTNLAVGRMIAEKESVEIVKMNDPRVEAANTMRGILNDMGAVIEIEYESIYGDKWLLTSEQSIPIKK
ncbi:MAG: hypothetical protein AAFO07_10885 [Bacteroidota bacterium]